MKYLIIALVLAAVSTLAMGATSEYRIDRVYFAASDGVRYDSARGNLHIDRSQVFISSNAFWMKTELSMLHYLPGEAKVFEKYRFTSSDGKHLALTDSRGNASSATILRTNPLRVQFDNGVTLQFRQVGFSGKDRHPDIRSLQTVRDATEEVIANDDDFILPSP